MGQRYSHHLHGLQPTCSSSPSREVTAGCGVDVAVLGAAKVSVRPEGGKDTDQGGGSRVDRGKHILKTTGDPTALNYPTPEDPDLGKLFCFIWGVGLRG